MRSQLGRLAAAAAVGSALTMLPVGVDRVGAQTAAPYACAIGAGGASIYNVTATAVASPSPATVGSPVALSGFQVKLELATPVGGGTDGPVTGSATLDPGGTVTFAAGQWAGSSTGAVTMTGGSATVTAAGTPGATMQVPITQMTLSLPALAPMTCTPQGAPATISIPLAASPTPTPPPAPPAPPKPAKPMHAG